MSKALVVIDLQNDYFADGAYPLWNAEPILAHVLAAIESARRANIPVVLVQHVAERAGAPFFNPGTRGVELHPSVLAAAVDAPVVVKAFADAFVNTPLDQVLGDLGATELLVCGMMTQNCVTHTAISKTAEKYDVTVLVDCCTTVTEVLHLIALHALSTRVRLGSSTDVG